MKALITTLCIALTVSAFAQTNKVNQKSKEVSRKTNEASTTTRNTTQAVQDTKEMIDASKALLTTVFANKKKKQDSTTVEQTPTTTKANAPEKKSANPVSNLSAEAKLLFTGVKTKMTDVEKNQIAKLSGAVLAEDKQSFTVEGESAEVGVYPLDLNNDGSEEVFVIIGSSFMYGNTGQGFDFLMKDQTGNYKSVLSFPGIPSLIQTKGKTMPAVKIGGPGFVFPVYDWNGSQYVLIKNYNTKNKTIVDATELSITYTSSLQ